MEILPYLRDIVLAFVVAVGFALLFQTPRRVLWVAGALGGLGHCVRFALLTQGAGIVPGTLVAAVVIGLAGLVVSHRVHTPPVVSSILAGITH